MSSIIIQNCNNCELDIPAKYALKLYNDLTVRHPNAFYLKGRVKNWDGKVHFISKSGLFKIGLLPRVYNLCKEYGLDVKIIDHRRVVYPSIKSIKIPKTIGGLKLRPEQKLAVSSVLYNQIGGITYRVGIIDYTVNAGKSLIMAALYHAFKGKLKTLLITNDADWLKQAKTEFLSLIPEEDLTFVQGSKVFGWKNFSIGMVQSISRNIKIYQRELTKIDMVLVDEADLASSKSYQSVLTHLFNTQVRLGLSGTIYMSKLARDRLKNMNLEAFFGPTLAEFKLIESIKKGYSTKVIVKVIDTKPWYGNWGSEATEYQEIYEDTITNNPIAYKIVLDRLNFNAQYGRFPALLVCKYIKHCENLYKYLKKRLDKKYIIAKVHVDTPTKERDSIIKKFREGKIDILISTTIIARGKNLPLLKLMINTACIDSQEKNIQFLGRLVRLHSSKKKVYLEDLSFPGKYLSRHSNHRRIYYQKQGLKVIRL